MEAVVKSALIKSPFNVNWEHRHCYLRFQQWPRIITALKFMTHVCFYAIIKAPRRINVLLGDNIFTNSVVGEAQALLLMPVCSGTLIVQTT